MFLLVTMIFIRSFHRRLAVTNLQENLWGRHVGCNPLNQISSTDKNLNRTFNHVLKGFNILTT